LALAIATDYMMASANSLRVLSDSLDQQQVAMGSGMPVLDDQSPGNQGTARTAEMPCHLQTIAAQSYLSSNVLR
jgi:hypothetical protein